MFLAKLFQWMNRPTRSVRTKKPRQKDRLRVEQLEDRTMLSAFVLGPGGSVSAYNPSNGSTAAILSGGASQISASAVQQDTVFVRIGGAVYEHVGLDSNSGWYQIWGSGVSDISAGKDSLGNPTVFCNYGGAVWEHNGLNMNSGWSEVWGGGVSQISASQGQADTVFCNSNGAVWEHNGLNMNSGWSEVWGGGGVSQISAASVQADTVFCNYGGAVWEHVGLNQNSGWSQILASGATQISAGFSLNDGSPTVFVNCGGALWEHQGTNQYSGWSEIWNSGVTQISGSDQYADTVCVGYGDQTWIHSGTNMNSGWTQISTSVTVDHPLASSGSYVVVSGTLFGASGPSYLDVNQHGTADCWLLASLAAVAARSPSEIRSMFTYNGTAIENGVTVSLYSVRFYDTSGNAHYVTVDNELTTSWDGAGTPNGILWVALAEKAYAQANGAGWVVSGQMNTDSYAALDGGNAAWALQAITGKSAGTWAINPTNMAAAWNAGEFIVLGSFNNPSDTRIVGDHDYAVVAYSPSNSMPFEVYNPWGTDSQGWVPGYSQTVYGLFWATGAFLSQNFSDNSFGAAAGNNGTSSDHTTATPDTHAAVNVNANGQVAVDAVSLQIEYAMELTYAQTMMAGVKTHAA
jgi:hypothetical protein